ncbi:MAG: twin-arginine translocation signal domain-containing protein [Acidobacteria bacterium]|nr:MAG: twin-arginine translocation signal domain-containing protein [Acidobacteriota bacterium]
MSDRKKGPERRIGRRGFLGAVPAAVAAVAGAPAAARQAIQQQTASRFGKEALEAGEKLLGVDFTDAEEEMMLRGASRNLESFEALRKIDVPLDTEPCRHVPSVPPRPSSARGRPARPHPQGLGARRPHHGVHR